MQSTKQRGELAQVRRAGGVRRRVSHRARETGPGPAPASTLGTGGRIRVTQEEPDTPKCDVCLKAWHDPRVWVPVWEHPGVVPCLHKRGRLRWCQRPHRLLARQGRGSHVAITRRRQHRRAFEGAQSDAGKQDPDPAIWPSQRCASPVPQFMIKPCQIWYRENGNCIYKASFISCGK